MYIVSLENDKEWNNFSNFAVWKILIIKLKAY